MFFFYIQFDSFFPVSPLCCRHSLEQNVLIFFRSCYVDWIFFSYYIIQYSRAISLHEHCMLCLEFIRDSSRIDRRTAFDRKTQKERFYYFIPPIHFHGRLQLIKKHFNGSLIINLENCIWFYFSLEKFQISSVGLRREGRSGGEKIETFYSVFICPVHFFLHWTRNFFYDFFFLPLRHSRWIQSKSERFIKINALLTWSI